MDKEVKKAYEFYIGAAQRAQLKTVKNKDYYLWQIIDALFETGFKAGVMHQKLNRSK